MQLIIFSAILALSVAYPVYLISHEDEVHVPLTAKSTVTKSQVVDHESTFVHSIPVVHASPVLHASSVVHAMPVVHSAPLLHISVPSKTTVTKSSQSVNHGSLHTVPVVSSLHVPVYQKQKTTVTNSKHVVDHGSTRVLHAPVIHTAPVLVHSSSLVTLKAGDSAITHQSSTVHETVPIVAIHH